MTIPSYYFLMIVFDVTLKYILNDVLYQKEHCIIKQLVGLLLIYLCFVKNFI